MAEQAGLAYEELIKEQLSEERSRKESLERRALAVVTSSGTMTTLLIAVAALVVRPESLNLPTISEILFALALISFATAGIFGVLTNRPSLGAEPSPDWLSRLVWPSIWAAPDQILARRRATEARLETIKSFRVLNRNKVKLLNIAVTAEVVAIAAVALGIISVFW